MPSYLKSKIYLKTIVALSLISLIFTFTMSLVLVPKIDDVIIDLENKNVTLIFNNTSDMVEREYKKIEKFKTTSITKHKNMLKETTNVAWSILETQYQHYLDEKNERKKEQIKNKALILIKNLRYKSDGYFWINDFAYRMVVHPFQPSLNGKVLTNYKDPNGIYLFKDMVDKVNQDGEGFIKYSWPKPGYDIAQAKLSFVKGFLPWNWIIGTGTYIDDIEQEISKKKQDIIEQIKKNINSISIGESGYAFIFDENGKILFHPDKKMLTKNLNDIKKSLTGESYFDFFKRISQTKTQKAIYKWNKLVNKDNYNKISWVNYILDAKIYIAITAYEDEIKQTSNEINDLLLEHYYIKFVLILFFSLLFITMLLRPIVKLSNLSKKVQEGDYNVRSDINRDDEIGELSNAFNSMIDEIAFQINTLELEVDKQTSNLTKNFDGLEKIIGSTSVLLQITSLEKFTSNVLIQLNKLLNIEKSNSYFCMLQDGRPTILSSSGKFFDTVRQEIISPKSLEYLNQAFIEQKSLFIDDIYIGFYKSNDDIIFLYLENCDRLTKSQKHLIKIFSSIVSITFNNLNLNKEIIDTQKELLERLGEMVELKSEETAGHVKRVASISYALAIAYGISEEDAFILKLASPMHDIGKLGVPEDILKKPDKLTKEEFEIMKIHPSLGYDVFKGSKKQILKVASVVAYQHHEKWDGTGYPQGLKGEEIDIYARITTVADVFDALTQKRVYKKPWSTQQVLDFLDQNSGIYFDPKLVELLHQNIKEIEKFKEGYREL